jgi:hypothetical protein
MERELYPILIEEMVTILHISKKDLEADVQDIAEYWETCLDKAGILNRDTAILILTTCVSCYLKGRCIDLEDNETTAGINGLLLTLVTLIPLFAWTRPVTNYPKIHQLIPCKKEHSKQLETKSEVLSQAEEILRNRGYCQY